MHLTPRNVRGKLPRIRPLGFLTDHEEWSTAVPGRAQKRVGGPEGIGSGSGRPRTRAARRRGIDVPAVFAVHDVSLDEPAQQVWVVAVGEDGQVHFTVLPGSLEKNRHLIGRALA